MSSLYDELAEKLAQDPRLTKRGGARVDLSIMLFNARDSVRALWIAAEEEAARIRSEGRAAPADLDHAIEQLRPIFGDRTTA
jgi:hypothetical protein